MSKDETTTLDTATAAAEDRQMRIIDVVPIAKGIGIETLSYFTSIPVTAGNLVEVPLRSKNVAALVVNVREVQDMKSEIKRAPYVVKKVDKLKSLRLFPSTFISAAQKTADYFAASTGSVLNALIPVAILKNAKECNPSDKIVPSKSAVTEKYLVQGSDEDRYAYYRSLIREEFAKKASLFFLVPTIEDARRSQKLLEKGIEKYTFLLNTSMTKKKMVEVWNKIHQTEHPVLIIATAAFMCVNRPDIHTVIVERENSRSYKMMSRPFIDMRVFAEHFSEKIRARLVMGDMLLRVETLWRESEGELVQSGTFKFRSLSTAQDRLIDMRSQKTASGNWKIFSDEVVSLIRENKESSKLMFILTTRRGVAPSTVCGDCQNVVTCNNCGAPVVLHMSKIDENKSYFMCHRCGERRGVDETCMVCGSWKLGTIGIGIDMIEEKLKDKFPDVKVFRLDSDTTRTEKAIEDTVAKFYSSPGSILLGTEMALLYLREKIHNSAIISIDSLFSVPDYRIHEKVMYTLLKIRNETENLFILQTRKPDEKVLELALKGNLLDFYRLQADERKQFNYPPYTTLIKLTLEGERETISNEMRGLQQLLLPHELDVFPAFTQSARGKSLIHGLLKLPRGAWVDRELLAKLRSLPPQIEIKVDPDSLL